MDMDVERDGSILIATPKGRIDGLNAGEFSDELTAAIPDGRSFASGRFFPDVLYQQRRDSE